jgi:hypothetical protein
LVLLIRALSKVGVLAAILPSLVRNSNFMCQMSALLVCPVYAVERQVATAWVLLLPLIGLSVTDDAVRTQSPAPAGVRKVAES